MGRGGGGAIPPTPTRFLSYSQDRGLMKCPKCECSEQVEKVKVWPEPMGTFRWNVCKNCGLSVSVFSRYKERQVYHLLHHCWCNYFMLDIRTCKMCNPPDEDGMWEKYPYDPFEGYEGLVKKHFPDAVEIR